MGFKDVNLTVLHNGLVAWVHKKDLKKENTKEITIRIIVYAKNSLQQLKLSNIQRDGFTIYYYYFYTNTNKLN